MDFILWRLDILLDSCDSAVSVQVEGNAWTIFPSSGVITSSHVGLWHSKTSTLQTGVLNTKSHSSTATHMVLTSLPFSYISSINTQVNICTPDPASRHFT